jgi:hypothetical protein
MGTFEICAFVGLAQSTVQKIVKRGPHGSVEVRAKLKAA